MELIRKQMKLTTNRSNALRKSRFFTMLLVLLTVFAVMIPHTEFSHAEMLPPELIGEGAVLIDAKSGEIIYEKNAHTQYEPASTTKMITCILALENLDLNMNIPISHEAAYTDGSRIYLIEGEEISCTNVLYGLMLESANDAAVALGEAVSGSVEEFAKLMNEKAKECGALNTNFVNPNGLHADGHLSTPYDLAMIARYCMNNDMFRTLVSTYQYTVPATNKQDTRYFYNTNRLLYDTQHGLKYDGILGVKTGYTSQAGGCLVACAERNGTTLIAVSMKSTDMGRFTDCVALLDYGFATSYSYGFDVLEDCGGSLENIQVKRGTVNSVAIEAEQTTYYVTLPMDVSPYVVSAEFHIDDSIKVEGDVIEAGTQVGTIDIYETYEMIAQIPVVTKETVERGGPLSIFGIEDSTAKKIYIYAGIFAGLVIAFFVWAAIRRAKVRHRKAARRAERALEIARQRAASQADRDRRNWHY